MGTRLHAQSAQLGFDGIGDTHQNDGIAGRMLQIIDRGADGDRRAMVASHRVYGQCDVH